ncbi:MAG TPA: alpha/beta fold hydrolase, partial [Planctomycetes bacterium]|nr:alpha/beta fold hydrolase [Planctomycetota bacterium]
PMYTPGGVGDLSNPPTSTEPWSDAISKFWTIPGSAADPVSVSRFSPDAQLQSTQRVPVLMIVPKEQQGVTWGPFNPMIFCHGITRQRTDVLALADGMANSGFTTFSMDLPFHGFNFDDQNSDGIADNPFYAGPGSLFPFGATERTYEIDLQSTVDINPADGIPDTDPFGQLILVPGPDGVSEASGTYFLNFGSLLTTRSNIWQAVSDLVVLAETIPSLDVSNLDTDGDFVGDATLVPFPDDEVHYIGQSLGGIVGSVFAGSYIEDKLRAVTLSVPAGGLGKMLEASPAYHNRLTTFFASQDAFHGTTTFEQGVTLAQTIVDAADPASHAERAGFYHPIYMQEVVGGALVEPAVDANMDGIDDNPVDINLDGVRDVTWFPDWVVSNNSLNTHPAYAAAAPVVEPGLLAGTSALGRMMGLTPTSAAIGIQSAAENETLDIIVKYKTNHHIKLIV